MSVQGQHEFCLKRWQVKVYVHVNNFNHTSCVLVGRFDLIARTNLQWCHVAIYTHEKTFLALVLFIVSWPLILWVSFPLGPWTQLIIVRLLFSNSHTSCRRYTVKPSLFILSTGTIQIFSPGRIFSMPSTRKPKAKARNWRKLDMLCGYGNMDVMLGDGNSNSIERQLDSLINVRERRQDLQSFPNRANSSLENKIRDIDCRNEPVRESRLLESISILSGEMNARMSREMETIMDGMQTQICRAISSGISERIIPEIQNKLKTCLWTNMALSRVRPQMRMEPEICGRKQTRNVQRRTPG